MYHNLKFLPLSLDIDGDHEVGCIVGDWWHPHYFIMNKIYVSICNLKNKSDNQPAVYFTSSV